MPPTFLHPSASIHQLIDDDGKPLQAMEVLSHGRDHVMRLKRRLTRSQYDDAPPLRCSLCGTKVYLAAMSNGETFVFKHFREDGSCPHRTRNNLTQTQILALQYDGQRESARHKRLKNLVADSLLCDPHFSNIAIEQTWKGVDGGLRRPDVQSLYQEDIRIAFEVQLSTTFDTVMVEREIFYRTQGGLLVWVFASFDLEQSRLMEEMVFRNNNRNCFVVDEETYALSMAAESLMLRCYWYRPTKANGRIQWTMQQAIVPFNVLTRDLAGQRVFYVDTDREEARLVKELAGPTLAERLEDFWLRYEKFEGRIIPDVQTCDMLWVGLEIAFANAGVQLPSRHDHDLKLLLRALYSAKHGSVVGWGYPDLWGLSIYMLDRARPLAWAYLQALEHYGHLAWLESIDHKGKWRERLATLDSLPYLENHRFDDLIDAAFPDLPTPIPF